MNFTRHLFTQTARGSIASLVVCVLLAYGISGIIYFTTELAYSTELSFLYTLSIVGSNGVDALVALGVCQSLIRLLSRVRPPVLAYALLGGATFGASVLVEILLRLGLQTLKLGELLPQGSGTALWFKMSPVAVAGLYYYCWQRYSQLGQTISNQAFQLLQLEKLRTKAELDALQARINPHFLYNALNSIASLVRTDPDKAETMTLLLARLFRYTTGTNESHLNTVRNELDIVQTYLDIEQIRFGDRLRYSVQCSDVLNSVQVPRFLLQPLVENAIKHGVAHLTDGGEIIVRVRRDGPDIVLSVHDNGPPFPETLVAGYGLQSIQDKLRLLYGTGACLQIENGNHKQVVVQFVNQSIFSPDKSHANDTHRRRTAGPRPAVALAQ